MNNAVEERISEGVPPSRAREGRAGRCRSTCLAPPPQQLTALSLRILKKWALDEKKTILSFLFLLVGMTHCSEGHRGCVDTYTSGPTNGELHERNLS